MNSDEQDWALVARARSGDGEAFGELYDHHFDEVHGYIGDQVRDRATREELTARTFFSGLRSIDALRIGIDPPRTWLLRVAAETVRDHLRTSSAQDSPRRSTGPDTDHREPADDADPDDVMIRGLVHHLPDDQRRCLELRYLDGLDLDEIAQRMGRSPSAVAALHHRAVRRLQRLLDQDLPAVPLPPDRPPTMPRSRAAGTRPSADGTRP